MRLSEFHNPQQKTMINATGKMNCWQQVNKLIYHKFMQLTDTKWLEVNQDQRPKY